MRAAGCDHGIENRCSMCGLIWLPSPSDEPALRAQLQVVGDRSPASSGVRAKATAMPVPSSSRSVCSRREQQREERVVARLGGGAAVVAERPRAPAPGRRSRRTSRPSIPSTFTTAHATAAALPTHPLPCHTPAVPSDRMSLAPPWSLSPSSCSSFKECPLAFRFSYLDRLPEPPVAVDQQGHARAPGARAPPRPPGRRTHARRRARRPRPAPGSSSRPTPTSPTSSSPTRSGRSSTPTPSRSCASTSSSRTRAPCTPSASSSSSRPTSAAPGCAASSTASSSTRTASSWSPTTRPARCRPSCWEAKSLAGVHIYALLCERMLGRRPARVQLSTSRSPRRSSPRPPTSRSRGVERAHRRACTTRSRNACARDDFRPKPGPPVRLLHVQALLPRVRRRPGRRRGAARSGHGDRADAARSPRTFRRPRELTPQLARRLPVASADAARGCTRSTCGRRAASSGSAARARPRLLRLSSAADHGLLWLLRRRRPRRDAGRPRARAAPRRRARRRVARSPTVRSRRCSAGCGPRTTTRPRVRSPTGCAARSRARSRRATRRRRSPPRRCSPAARPRRCGSRSRRAVAASRVYMRMHHASDVVAGAALGVVLGAGRPPARPASTDAARSPTARVGYALNASDPPADHPGGHPVARSIAVTFDYRCPFACNGNAAVVAALRDGSDIDFRFMPFSLDQAHVEEGEPPVWEREPERVGHRHARAAVRHRGARRVPRAVLRRPPRAVRRAPRQGAEARPRRRAARRGRRGRPRPRRGGRGGRERPAAQDARRRAHRGGRALGRVRRARPTSRATRRCSCASWSAAASTTSSARSTCSQWTRLNEFKRTRIAR